MRRKFSAASGKQKVSQPHRMNLILVGDVDQLLSVGAGKVLSDIIDSGIVPYDVTELDELALAYATTIHKAQGSEYPIVVIPFMMNHYVMLQRSLFYTGVTRAKRALILVGEKRVVYFAIKNNKAVERNTKLAERLKGEGIGGKSV